MMRRKGFTLVEVMIVVAIIALLAAIAIPNLLRARMTANDSAAQATLRTISTAAETYAAANNGNFPNATGLDWATNVTPRYLNEDYTNMTRNGYNYNFTSSLTNYTATALAATCNSTGSRNYTVTTGGVLSAAACN